MNKLGRFLLWFSASVGVICGLGKTADWIWPPPPMVSAATARACFEEGLERGELSESMLIAKAKGQSVPALADQMLKPSAVCAP